MRWASRCFKIPYDRLQTQFVERFNIALSSGTLNNFNVEAYARLEFFEALAKLQLATANALHVDETDTNINSKRLILHTVSGEKWTLFSAHENFLRMRIVVIVIAAEEVAAAAPS